MVYNKEIKEGKRSKSEEVGVHRRDQRDESDDDEGGGGGDSDGSGTNMFSAASHPGNLLTL